MKSTLLKMFLAIEAMSVSVSALLPPYAQCGGLSWYTYEWQCEAGSTCSPIGTSSAFPNYQCIPDSGPVVAHTFPWAQCGGAGFTGPTICPPYWTCVKNNEWFSTCVADAGYVTPKSTTPGIAPPGGFCGESATARGYPSVCAFGYTCTGPGVYGYYVCLLNPKIPVTTTAVPTTLTTKSVTTSKTTTTKKPTTTKKTSSTKLPATSSV